MIIDFQVFVNSVFFLWLDIFHFLAASFVYSAEKVVSKESLLNTSIISVSSVKTWYG